MILSAALEAATPLGRDTQDDVAQWMEADTDEPGHQVLDDDEIVADMLAGESWDNEESSERKLLMTPVSMQVKHLML